MDRFESQAKNNTPRILRSVFNSFFDEKQEHCPTILLMGASSPGLATDIATLAEPRGAVIHLIEHDPKLSMTVLDQLKSINLCLEQACSTPYDLRIDSAYADGQLRQRGCRDLNDWKAIKEAISEQASISPVFEDESVDIVVIDMLLNRLSAREANQTIAEAFRVLKNNGLLLMTAILADEPVATLNPKEMNGWTAINFPVEMDAMTTLQQTGYYGVQILNTRLSVAATLAHAELGEYIFEARKGKQGVCLDQGHAVIFRGPWLEAYDDDGHKYVRGERTAVCIKTFELLMRPPYSDFFIGLPCRSATSVVDAPLFDCATPKIRSPQVTKGSVGLDSGVCTSSSCC